MRRGPRDTRTWYRDADPLEQVDRALVDFVAAHAGRAVLDLGCGLGGYSRALAERGFELRGLDVVPEYVERARSIGVDAELYDGRQIPMEDRSVDTVMLLEVLEHLDDPAGLLREARRVARQGVLVTTPNCTQDFGDVPVEFSHMLDVDHRQFFTESSLGQLLDEVFGSSVVEQTAPIDRHLAGILLPQPLRRPSLARQRRGRQAAVLLPPARARARRLVTRVLFVSAEPVAAAMAGPAIRVVELARALAPHCHVTVAAPAPSDSALVPGELLEAGLFDFDRLLGAMRTHDVVVAQRLPPQLLRYAARLPIRFVADLYNPQMIEVLEAAGAADGDNSARRAWRSMLGQCAVADLVVCASEKQRDLWLGGMGLAGLVDRDRYRADPTFRQFVDVVPFGLPEEPPRRDAPVMRGVWPGIGADDRVLLWAGGIWRWLDALTPIRALERLQAEWPSLHLVFMGTGRPSLDPGDVPTSVDEAVRFARERGLEGRSVHFNPGWISYEERGAYLLEADVGVCAHHDHLEARFSFRTRVLDHFWAGLPSVVSSGDSIGDLVERRGLGSAVPPDDDEAFAAALARLLDDNDHYAQVCRRVGELAPALRWSECARPLVDFCRAPDRHPRRRPPRGALARATFGQYPDLLASLREHGGLGEAARALPRHVARVLRHRA